MAALIPQDHGVHQGHGSGPALGSFASCCVEQPQRPPAAVMWSSSSLYDQLTKRFLTHFQQQQRPFDVLQPDIFMFP
jgi:hypothetical protein